MEAAVQPQELTTGLPRTEVDSRRASIRAKSTWWVAPAFVAVIVLAAVTYVYNLAISGYANAYYSMAAQAAGLDWKAWFFGSLDPANFITVDKPPLATMLMGLSVRLFGLSSWSILLPQALAGVATVALVYVIVRKQFGPAAATISAFVTAVTPVAVLMFRFNNPDALLTLLLVAAAWSFWRALTDGRLRWIVLSAALVGLAFNTKFLQAYLVLPAFALTYLIAAKPSLWRRIGHLVIAFVVVIVSSFWWVAAVELTPVADRPYIGGSGSNSALELLIGYDGIQRISGLLSAFGMDRRTDLPFSLIGSVGSGFSGAPGVFRLFNDQFAGQIAWLIPFALVGLVVGLVARARAPRTDLRRAAYIFWGLWLLVSALVFSFMSGIIHTYYAVTMAPAIGALVGAGTVELWSAAKSAGRRRYAARAVLAAAIAGSSLWAAEILNRSPEFMPWLAPTVALAGLVGAIGVLLLDPRPAAPETVAPGEAHTSLAKIRVALASGAAAVGLIAIAAGPAAFAMDTVNSPHRGGDPQAGPLVTGRFIAAGGPGLAGQGAGPAEGQRDLGQLPPNAGAPGSNFGPGLGLDNGLVSFLEANQGGTRWAVAVRSSNEAANIQLESGLPVMTMGGFSGGDQTLTVDQLKAYVANGELRYVLLSGSDDPRRTDVDGGFRQTAGPLGSDADGPMKDALEWVRENGKVVYSNRGDALYDLSGVFDL